MDLEAYPESTEAILEQQRLREEEMNVANFGSLEDRYGDRRKVVRRRRGAKKRIQDSVGSRQELSAPGSDSCIRVTCASSWVDEKQTSSVSLSEGTLDRDQIRLVSRPADQKEPQEG
jgi:hypothetical protein